MFGGSNGLAMVAESDRKATMGYLPSFVYQLYLDGNIDRKIKYINHETLESVLPYVQDTETKVKIYKEMRRSRTERMHSNSMIVREITGIIDFIETMADAGQLTWKIFKAKRGIK